MPPFAEHIIGDNYCRSADGRKKRCRNTEDFREQFIEARRDVIRRIFKRYQNSQEIKAETNIELIMDLIFGALWYRLLMEHAPLDEQFANDLIDHITFLLL